MDDLFLTSVRSKEDVAGVMEFDGEVGYFYLYDLRAPEGKKIIGSLKAFDADDELAPDDVVLGWDADEKRVGFFIRNTLWGGFEVQGRRKFGGAYKTVGAPPIDPADVFLKSVN